MFFFFYRYTCSTLVTGNYISPIAQQGVWTTNWRSELWGVSQPAWPCIKCSTSCPPALVAGRLWSLGVVSWSVPAVWRLSLSSLTPWGLSPSQYVGWRTPAWRQAQGPVCGADDFWDLLGPNMSCGSVHLGGVIWIEGENCGNPLYYLMQT